MNEHEENQSLEGWEPKIASAADLNDALEKAFHYRGDITLKLKEGEVLECFLFNRDFDAASPFVSVYPAETGSQARKVTINSIETLIFSGKDTATGNSWEAWVARWEAKHGPRP